MNRALIEELEVRHFHLFCGLGGGARGFNRGAARVGNLRARFRCLGGVDVDPASVRDFARLAGVPATLLDMFDREQYAAFHGREPGQDWREATPDDIRRAAAGERPNIVFLSAPCKGFSGLLSESRSKSEKYQALNRLTLRGVWLMLEAFADQPPELVLFENVPRIQTRGRALLDQIGALLGSYGYAVAETTHDCGALGGLAQSRKRFLLVARHVAQVPAFLYQPPKRPLRAVGEVLGRMPLPGDTARGGAMHALPNLQWKTWVRLAFVEAGSDWRSLNKLRVVDGKLADYLLVPNDWFKTGLGVCRWDEHSGTVTGDARPHKGECAIADPRISGVRHNNVFRVVAFDEVSQAVTAGGHPTSGGLAVADPRTGKLTHSSHGVSEWQKPAHAIAGESWPSNGRFAVADPRPPRTKWGEQSGSGKYIITRFDSPANSIIAQATTGSGAFAVADPRIALAERGAEGSGPYGIAPWNEPAPTVAGSASHDNGRFSVADPRVEDFHLPEASTKLVALIRALDGTWHRPFTTLELAALQSLVDVAAFDAANSQEPTAKSAFALDGDSDSSKRERIGNAVPPDAAQAVADLMGDVLLRAHTGETFQLSEQPIWVRPVAVALSVRGVHGWAEAMRLDAAAVVA